MNNSDDLVVGIDSSTTGAKAIAWNRYGEAVSEGRFPISLSNLKSGQFEQNSEDWWTSAVEALEGVLQTVSRDRISALSSTN